MAYELGARRVALDSPEFWSEEAVERELRRQFEVCHSCRLCLSLCPAFPALFGFIDHHDGDVEKLTSQDLATVVDLCYQCKLCFLKCPYNPPHEFALDIPRLVLRARAVRARRQGLSWAERFLGSIDFTGKWGSFAAPLANWANDSQAPRALLERAVGVHRERILPRFHHRTFARWFAEHKKARPFPVGTNGKVTLFYTCLVNYTDPDVGIAAVQVLEKNGVEVICPPQRCCGMPYLDMGDVASAIKNMGFNAGSLSTAVEEGYEVVVPEPTCGMMLRKEYPDFLDAPAAGLVAQHTYDICEYLLRLHKEGKLSTDFSRSPGRIAYHMPCHLKYQQIGNKSLELLRLIPGATVEFVDRGCSGMDGTWGMRKDHFALSLKVAGGLLEALKEAQPDLAATDCSLAARQIEQGTGMKPLHPVQVLRSAYGL